MAQPSGKIGREGGDTVSRRWAVLMPILTLGLVACAARQPQAPQYPAPLPFDPDEVALPAAQTEPLSVEQQLAGQEGIARVVVTDEGFEPDSLAARRGDRVKIHLRNLGTREHTLTLPRWGIYPQNLPPGGETYIEFTASEAGVFRFYSDASGEPEPGLDGELRVE